MKNTKNTTVLKSNLKNRKNRHKMNTLTHVYMTAHIPRLVQKQNEYPNTRIYDSSHS